MTEMWGVLWKPDYVETPTFLARIHEYGDPTGARFVQAGINFLVKPVDDGTIYHVEATCPQPLSRAERGHARTLFVEFLDAVQEDWD